MEEESQNEKQRPQPLYKHEDEKYLVYPNDSNIWTPQSSAPVPRQPLPPILTTVFRLVGPVTVHREGEGDEDFRSHLLSQRGSLYTCLGRYVPEIHSIARTLSEEEQKKKKKKKKEKKKESSSCETTSHVFGDRGVKGEGWPKTKVKVACLTFVAVVYVGSPRICRDISSNAWSYRQIHCLLSRLY